MGKNRLHISIGVLAVLIGLTVWQFNARKVEDLGGPIVSVDLPKVDKEQLDELSVSSPDKGSVKLAKKDGTWRMVEPVDAQADQNAITTAVDKLAEIEVTGVAATKQQNHERLEVTEDKAVHVVASGGGKPILDLWIGKYQSGNTMVRSGKDEAVATVKGSIKFAFNKEVRSWRHREISKLDTATVTAIAFENSKGTLRFVRGEDDEWAQAEGEKPIEDFDANKVKSIVSSVSNLRAVDFAEPGVTREQAGLAEGSGGKITLTLVAGEPKKAEEAKEGEAKEGEEPKEAAAPTEGDAAKVSQEVFRVGNMIEEQYYAGRDGDPIVYRVSGWIGKRLLAEPEQFKKTEEKPGQPQAAANPHTIQLPKPGDPNNVIQVPPSAIRTVPKPAAK